MKKVFTWLMVIIITSLSCAKRYEEKASDNRTDAQTRSSVNDCASEQVDKEFPYFFYESTGQNEYILDDAKQKPIHFDEKSNVLALRSLGALSARVLYPNSKGKIILSGDYNPQSESFLLCHWYIKIPFTELTLENRIQMPEEIHKITRHTLERTDFERRGDFDPDASDFNPHLFEKK